MKMSASYLPKGMKVRILTTEEIEEKYSKNNNTRMANLTKQALDKGYLIALVEQKDLEHSDHMHLEIQWAVESLFPEALHEHVEIWGYTDMSELSKGKIYCAFKVDESKGWGNVNNTFHND